jgi:hypothetical protein
MLSLPTPPIWPNVAESQYSNFSGTELLQVALLHGHDPEKRRKVKNSGDETPKRVMSLNEGGTRNGIGGLP